MGRRTCASASALNFEAQPAQVERVVNRIFFSDGDSKLVIRWKKYGVASKN